MHRPNPGVAHGNHRDARRAGRRAVVAVADIVRHRFDRLAEPGALRLVGLSARGQVAMTRMSTLEFLARKTLAICRTLSINTPGSPGFLGSKVLYPCMTTASHGRCPMTVQPVLEVPVDADARLGFKVNVVA